MFSSPNVFILVPGGWLLTTLFLFDQLCEYAVAVCARFSLGETTLQQRSSKQVRGAAMRRHQVPISAALLCPFDSETPISAFVSPTIQHT